MREIWKDVVGYEGLYQVSNFGRVKHLEYTFTNCSGSHVVKEKIINSYLQNNGYRLCHLYKKNTRKMFLLHRLVAEAFIPNPNNYPIINHKDSNPQNCEVSNLEWCTYSYNAKYSYDTTNRKEKMNWKKGKENANSKPVYATDKDGNILFHFDCIMDAQRSLGILNSGIVACLKRKTKTAGGYIWHYEK